MRSAAVRPRQWFSAIGATRTRACRSSPRSSIGEAEFVRLWEPSRFWALLVGPGDNAVVTSGPSAQLAAALRSSSIPQRNACDALLNRAIADIAARGLSAADTSLATVREQCPESPAPLRELPG